MDLALLERIGAVFDRHRRFDELEPALGDLVKDLRRVRHPVLPER